MPSPSASVSSVESNGKASVASGVPSLSSSVSLAVPYGETVAAPRLGARESAAPSLS